MTTNSFPFLRDLVDNLPMDIYLVGGAVRDELLHLKVQERDWVVVGSRISEMEKLGFQQVGKDFPVFLHPDSKEEYALARIERKISAGHKGFECDASEAVTLEEDLLRRDLTINAIAKTDDGTLIDPYDGLADLEQRVLRHVSPAFTEDPLRILRLARFYARFPEFSVADETITLVEDMVSSDQLKELAAERIWAEVQKALETRRSSRFFELLSRIGAHDKLWPSLNKEKLSLLAAIETQSLTIEQKFATVCWTASETLESDLIKLKVPNRFLDLALAVHRHMDAMLVSKQLVSEQLVSEQLVSEQATDAHVDVRIEQALALMYQLDAFRRPERFKLLSDLSRLIATAEDLATPPDWYQLFELTNEVSSAQIDPGFKGPEFGRALRQARLDHLAAKLLI